MVSLCSCVVKVGLARHLKRLTLFSMVWTKCIKLTYKFFIFVVDFMRYVPLPMSLSHSSTSDFVMDRLEAHVDKRKSSSKGATIAVPMGKKLVVFIDDLHAPQPEVCLCD
jgi:P-loop containing dynein motor region